MTSRKHGPPGASYGRDRWLAAASIFGLTAVAAGAFGAHVLEQRLSPSQLSTFELAVRYHMYHALALLALPWMQAHRPSRILRAGGICMVLGIVLFSGSLYLLALSHWKWVGMVTPIGGSLLIAGWGLFAASALRRFRGSADAAR